MDQTRRRGVIPKGKVRIEWTPNFAYAVGLLVADGSLSKDGRHLNFTSKDRELVEIFSSCLGLSNSITTKSTGRRGESAYQVQFGDILFYRFFLTIGLMPAKSTRLKALDVPPDFFADFLRGYFDGDGTSFSFFDPVYRNSYRFYISFTTASFPFAQWLAQEIILRTGAKGHFSRNKNNDYVQIRFGKEMSCNLVNYMYYRDDVPRLSRKKLKIDKSLRIIMGRRDGEIGRHATFRS